MEPFIVDVEPTEESHFSLSSHEGEEFIYVMEGAVEVCHGKKCRHQWKTPHKLHLRHQN